MAKKYRLLKDLPTFKAGEEFFISDNGNLIAGTPSDPKQITVETRYGLPMKIDLMAYAQETLEEFPNILKDWFEEIKEPELPKEFFFIVSGKIGNVEYLTFSLNEDTKQEYKNIIEEYKGVGNYFETRDEAEKYLKYLKAKVVIKRDTKGFKPDWENFNEEKYYGVWDFDRKKADYFSWGMYKGLDIYFKSKEDIKESFKKHPKEWKAYLNYEQ
nr:MAG TPA: hypothetical protein [Caudoviricetes sp.]